MYSSLVKKILLLSIFTLPFSVLSQDGGGFFCLIFLNNQENMFFFC